MSKQIFGWTSPETPSGSYVGYAMASIEPDGTATLRLRPQESNGTDDVSLNMPMMDAVELAQSLIRQHIMNQGCGAWVTSIDPPGPFDYSAPKPLMVDHWPRRARVECYTPAEAAITNAIRNIEVMPFADVRLTKAQMVLGQAREILSNYVDEKIKAGEMEIPGRPVVVASSEPERPVRADHMRAMCIALFGSVESARSFCERFRVFDAKD